MPEVLFQELNKVQAMKGYNLLTKRNHVGRVCLVGPTKFFQNSCFEVAIGKNALYNSTTAQPTLNVVTEVTGEESLAYCYQDDSSVRNTIFFFYSHQFQGSGAEHLCFRSKIAKENNTCGQRTILGQRPWFCESHFEMD